MGAYKKLSITPEAYKALLKFKVDNDIRTMSEAILRLIKEVEKCRRRKSRK